MTTVPWLRSFGASQGAVSSAAGGCKAVHPAPNPLFVRHRASPPSLRIPTHAAPRLQLPMPSCLYSCAVVQHRVRLLCTPWSCAAGAPAWWGASSGRPHEYTAATTAASPPQLSPAAYRRHRQLDEASQADTPGWKGPGREGRRGDGEGGEGGGGQRLLVSVCSVRSSGRKPTVLGAGHVCAADTSATCHLPRHARRCCSCAPGPFGAPVCPGALRGGRPGTASRAGRQVLLDNPCVRTHLPA